MELRPQRARVLYVSYTGLLDPLGQSQVLQYVLDLAGDHQMILLSFEKRRALLNRSDVEAVEAECRARGVDWYRLTYHNRPGIPATILRSRRRLAGVIDPRPT